MPGLVYRFGHDVDKELVKAVNPDEEVFTQLIDTSLKLGKFVTINCPIDDCYVDVIESDLFIENWDEVETELEHAELNFSASNKTRIFPKGFHIVTLDHPTAQNWGYLIKYGFYIEDKPSERIEPLTTPRYVI